MSPQTFERGVSQLLHHKDRPYQKGNKNRKRHYKLNENITVTQ